MGMRVMRMVYVDGSDESDESDDSYVNGFDENSEY